MAMNSPTSDGGRNLIARVWENPEFRAWLLEGEGIASEGGTANPWPGNRIDTDALSPSEVLPDRSERE